MITPNLVVDEDTELRAPSRPCDLFIIMHRNDKRIFGARDQFVSISIDNELADRRIWSKIYEEGQLSSKGLEATFDTLEAPFIL